MNQSGKESTRVLGRFPLFFWRYAFLDGTLFLHDMITVFLSISGRIGSIGARRFVVLYFPGWTRWISTENFSDWREAFLEKASRLLCTSPAPIGRDLSSFDPSFWSLASRCLQPHVTITRCQSLVTPIYFRHCAKRCLCIVCRARWTCHCYYYLAVLEVVKYLACCMHVVYTS